MHQVRYRSYYCPKLGKKVELLEYVRWEDDLEGVCGILSCSHQDICAQARTHRGEPVFPWGTCPACREKRKELACGRAER